MIPEDDRGLLLGDGLFETLLAEDGELRDFDRHMARLARGCAVLGLEPPEPGAALTLAKTALEGSGLAGGRAAVRLTLTGGSGRGLDRPAGSATRLLASAGPAPRPAGPARLVTAEVRRNEGSPASRLKTLNYLDNVLARAEARAAGADEAVMLNNRGEVACAAAANLFWIRGGRLCTPALECGVLDGITRARVIEAARGIGMELAEVRATRAELGAAEGLFLTNSLIGVRLVASLDGREVPEAEVVETLAGLCG
jgi:branched-subunit amino acid aminotransferase/4-amino-4-deoxychorismate lyase